MGTLAKFVPLSKVTMRKDGTCEVWGWAAEEAPDQSNEIMDYAASRPHFLKWSERIQKASGGKSYGNVRSMHQNIAAGKLIAFVPRDDLLKFWVKALIIDPVEVKKCVEGVYTGFSVGGDYGKRWPDSKRIGFTRYEAIPNELTLADNPCMYGATFEMVKANGAKSLQKFAGGKRLDKVEGPEQLAEKIRLQWRQQFEPPSEAINPANKWIVDVLYDRVIVQHPDGLYAYLYTMTEGDQVVFNAPFKVERSYLPVASDIAKSQMVGQLRKASKHKYPWDECMRDQTKRYGSEETARKVCGMIRSKYGKSAAAGHLQKAVAGEPEPDIEYDGDLDIILKNIEAELDIRPAQTQEAGMGKTKKTKGKSQTSRALNKMDMPEHDPELDQTLGEVEAVLEDAQAAVETAAETIADAAAQTDDPNAQRALDEAAAQTTETASQVSETVAAVAEAAGAVTGTQTSDETTDTESQSGQAQTGEEGSEETMEAETEDEAESPEEGAEDMTGEPAQRLTADDVRAIVMDILEELGVVQRLAAAATAGDLRKSVKSVFKGLSKAARASDVHKLTGDVGRVAVAVEQVLERLNKIEQPSHGPVLREISLLGANGSLASATDIEALEETLQKVSDPVARQVIGQKLTELRIRNAHATGGKNISFNQGA